MIKWWYLHAPHLLLDAQLSQQAVADQPYALWHSHGNNARFILQANASAQAAGVKVGMAEVTASTLVSELQSQPYQAEKEQQVLERLAQVLHQDIAQIALHPPQGLLLEVASLELLYTHPERLLRRLRARLRMAGIRYQLGVGAYPLTAQLLAQAGGLPPQQLVQMSGEACQQAVQQLPLSACSLAPKLLQQLQDIGLNTVADLLRLPSAELGLRFGQQLTRWVANLQGQWQVAQDYYQPPAYFHQRLDLLSEVQSWPQLLFPLKRLLQQLEAFLQSHQWSVSELLVTAHHREQTDTVVTLRFGLPLWRARELLNLAQLQLERHQLTAPVLELTLHAETFSARNPSHTTPANHLAVLVGKLQARLGEQAVQQPYVCADWRPEYTQAWRLGSVSTTPALPERLRKRRPVWLLAQAQPTQRQDWQLQWGPERLQSGWWDDHPIARDYFIAIDAQQRQGWIFHCEQGWFLHGWFT